MPRLIPSMEPEAPRDYVDFVVGQIPMVRAEAARLIGGDPQADQVYNQALMDVAGRWHQFTWQRRFSHRDNRADFLRRRLRARAEQWREDRIYPVDVVHVPNAATATFEVTSPAATWAASSAPFRETSPVGASSPVRAISPAQSRAYRPVGAADTVARQMAPLLPATVRTQAAPVAEAEIAWEHAYRRYRMWRLALRCAAVAFVVGEITHFMSGIGSP